MKKYRKNYPYKKYKKAYFDRLTRNLWGEYDENDTYIPWRFIIWSVKYGVSSSKYTRKDGKGIISFIDKEIFETYVKPWICATKSQRKQLRNMNLDYVKLVKKALRVAKNAYTIYISKKYDDFIEFK